MEKKQESSSIGTKVYGRYLIAFLFIAWGALLFGRNMEWITPQAFDLLVSWQMLMVVVGLFLILRRQFFSGGVLLVVSTYFINDRLGWCTAMDVRPLVLIFIGVMIALKWGGRKKKHSPRMDNFVGNQSHSTDGFVRTDNAFSGVRQVVLDEVFKGGSIRNHFGGTVLDLRRTTLEEGETYLDVDCNFGGIEIFVPADWKVKFLCNAFLGSCEDKRFGGGVIDQSRVLIVRGNVSFAGIEVKN